MSHMKTDNTNRLADLKNLYIYIYIYISGFEEILKKKLKKNHKSASSLLKNNINVLFLLLQMAAILDSVAAWHFK